MTGEEPLLPDVYKIAPVMAEVLKKHLDWHEGSFLPVNEDAFLAYTREVLAAYERWAHRGGR